VRWYVLIGFIFVQEKWKLSKIYWILHLALYD
jgi:hypothetical protein